MTFVRFYLCNTDASLIPRKFMFKKNIYILFLLPLFYWNAYAENYKVDGFSDQYYGYIDQNDDESGTMTIKDKNLSIPSTNKF